MHSEAWRKEEGGRGLVKKHPLVTAKHYSGKRRA